MTTHLRVRMEPFHTHFPETDCNKKLHQAGLDDMFSRKNKKKVWRDWVSCTAHT